jgi:hypothetical protein
VCERGGARERGVWILIGGGWIGGVGETRLPLAHG